MSVENRTPTSIYIHIPFCVKKCPYCDFNSYGVGNDEPALAEAYTEAVCRELKFYLDNCWLNRELCSVFFGGGTPSLLSADKLGSMLGVIRDNISLSSDIEVTIEANPGTVQEQLGLEKLAQLRELGFNRISFGSQSFSKRKLELLGRLHSPEDIIKAVGNARAAGFRRLNLDLIFGVKGETQIDYEEDILKTIAISPEHISAYSLTIEPGTEFGKLEKRGLRMVETEEIQADLFEQTQSALRSNSYLQYEVSNYSKVNEECRHNLHYWRRGNYLGIGAGAHGFLSDSISQWGKRWFNIPKPEHYIERVQKRLTGHHAEENLTIEQAKIEFISLALRTGRGLIIEHYNSQFNESFCDKYSNAISSGVEHRVLEECEGSIRVTNRGFILVNSVVEKFL